jgi:ketosteroid isomerase-like protein
MMDQNLTHLQVARAYWDAEERRDLDAVMGYYHDDASLVVPGATLRGKAEIRTYYEPGLEAFPGLEVRIKRDIVNGEWALFEYEAVFTDAEGKRTPFEGCNVVQIVDGKYTYVRGYFDPTQFG